MIAHLPMYDVPANRDAHGRLWDLFFGFYGGGGQTMPDADIWQDWMSPNLLLSQTCGLPYRSKLHGQVTLVAPPDNRLDGCPAGYYRSAIITRGDADIDLAANNFTFAYNEALSQSGWAAPWGEGITGKTRLQTGGHLKSVQAVQQGAADVEAIDALTWHFVRRDGAAAGLKVIHWTRPTPTLPFITSRTNDPAPIRAALAAAIDALDHADRDTLRLYGLVDVPAQDYLAVPIPPAP